MISTTSYLLIFVDWVVMHCIDVVFHEAPHHVVVYQVNVVMCEVMYHVFVVMYEVMYHVFEVLAVGLHRVDVVLAVVLKALLDL